MLGAATLGVVLGALALGSIGAEAASKRASPSKRVSTTTAAPDDVTPKTFCDGWASVRNVRSSGLTGIRALRVQAERYQALIGLSPASVKADVVVMAEYFSTTLAMADKPLNNAKQAAKLEALIPKIGDALTAVTRHAVRTCPRSVVLPASTTSTSIDASTTPGANKATTTIAKARA